jgi:hypothetical protein
MLQAPDKLFEKAASLGFDCSTDTKEHRIIPGDPSANWHLVYRAGHWTLVINGVPQINLRYPEVDKFLERRFSLQ